jgi:hypothetical protein
MYSVPRLPEQALPMPRTSIAEAYRYFSCGPETANHYLGTIVLSLTFKNKACIDSQDKTPQPTRQQAYKRLFPTYERSDEILQDKQNLILADGKATNDPDCHFNYRRIRRVDDRLTAVC